MYKKILKKMSEALGYKLVNKDFIKNQRSLDNYNLINIRLILKLIFNNNNIKSLIQIGANDGKRFDHISEFIKNKDELEAILVEPVKKYFEQLKENYKDLKNIKFENSAISKNNEINFLYCVKDKFLENYQDHIKGINSHEMKHLLNHNVKESHIEKIKVETLTFSNLIKKYDLTEIDLIYIDVEGYDDKIVLDFLDNSKLRPILIFEYIHIKNTSFEILIKKLIDENYRILKVDENVICYNENFKII
tara:strand:- start:1354 stop:2097 length:744 start_codon:yes stop_codon:yes gene_type:complete